PQNLGNKKARHPTAHVKPGYRCSLPGLAEFTGSTLHRTRPTKTFSQIPRWRNPEMEVIFVAFSGCQQNILWAKTAAVIVGPGCRAIFKIIVQSFIVRNSE